MSRYHGISGRTAAAIAASIERAVHSGALADGDRLPAIRGLARRLHVSPVTVTAAYRMLRSRGLTQGKGRRGTALRIHPAAALPAVSANRDTGLLVDLATGNPDPALLPSLGGALRGGDPDARLYGGPFEFPELVEFASAEFAADGIVPGPVTVTSGGLDAIERLLREYAGAGDQVAVEDPTFPALLDVLASLGLQPAPFGIDDEGARPKSLERVLGPRVQAMVLSSRAQNPTGAFITEQRGTHLRRILRRAPRALLIEIDDSAAVSGAPLVTLAAGREHWAVVRSTSKWLGPDLRVAVVTGDPITIARLRRRQAISVRWVSHLLQRLTWALWSDPSSGRLFARASEIYAERRNALIDALSRYGMCAHGKSGLNVWIPVREETATVQALAECGWAVAAGERFRLQCPPAIRVTTSALPPEEAKRFAADLVMAARVQSPLLA